MFTTIAAIAAAALSPVQSGTAAHAGGFDAVTADHHVGKGVYCIRSGWQTATWESGRRVRQGDCRTAAEWRTRGLTFDQPARKTLTPRVDVAAR